MQRKCQYSSGTLSCATFAKAKPPHQNSLTNYYKIDLKLNPEIQSMKQPNIDWPKAVKPLIKKYKSEKHPLDAKNLYQMLVMVVLSGQTTDNIVNEIAPALFKKYPSMREMSTATPEDVQASIIKIRNFVKKSNWLVKIAQQIKKDSAIPTSMKELVAFPGIGRKSANVIKQYAGAEIEGIVVDLHTIRVANRLGIVDTEDPKKLEERMMEILPKEEWEVGMCMSFHGREICRPNPKCEICFMRPVCRYYNTLIK